MKKYCFASILDALINGAMCQIAFFLFNAISPLASTSEGADGKKGFSKLIYHIAYLEVMNDVFGFLKYWFEVMDLRSLIIVT